MALVSDSVQSSEPEKRPTILDVPVVVDPRIFQGEESCEVSTGLVVERDPSEVELLVYDINGLGHLRCTRGLGTHVPEIDWDEPSLEGGIEYPSVTIASARKVGQLQ